MSNTVDMLKRELSVYSDALKPHVMYHRKNDKKNNSRK